MFTQSQMRRLPAVELIRSPSEVRAEAARAAREAFLRAEADRQAQAQVRRRTGHLRVVASA